MKSKNSYSGIDPIIVKYVRYHAYYLKYINYFAHESLEDIEQELFCEVLPFLDQYDEKRSSYNTFIAKVTQCRARNLLRSQSSAKHQITFGVDDSLPDCKHLESGMIARIDVSEMMSRLPKSYRNICELLKIFNISEISKMTGIPKTTIYNVIRQIRSRFSSCK
ncbi:RNA polymerase sigma factor [Wolbachia endosymbiont of Folsomia candida]|uniref:RNA polymerase sigma factor n=1 Tax=Wolbachia endosymbiont of Folsomia candida TaxID=169402 RepID=UPI000AACE7A4|nr:sigma-70 family RNA polymerase sigma factor [Wolbachia endosymbiont of Folsomia candida]APR99009.1 sigma-70 family RNA polymerase sigma factor [Wolbachia endosymbiont of Folsomia candida]